MTMVSKLMRFFLFLSIMVWAASSCTSTGSDTGSDVPPVTSLLYAIVDTGQSNCYDNTTQMSCPSEDAAFYGQDAQYEGFEPSYQNNGDGTVTDLNTGLMWQKTPDFDNKSTYAEALAGADTFSLAGYDDWRLPTIKELYSLINFNGVTGITEASSIPYIDTDFFDFEYGDTSGGERFIDAQYCSSTPYVGTVFNGQDAVFGVNFADGRIKGYPQQGMTFYVQYVRDNTEYGENNFADNSDGTISDQATSLIWMQDDSGTGLDWEDALSYCEDLIHGNANDWRLPNIKELQSIVDYTRSPDTTDSAAINPVFNTTSIINEGGETDYPYFWSSTTHLDGPEPGNFAAYIAFGRALGYMEEPPNSANYVLLDVHGAGAQRSDPKSGDPDDWPNGFGPQGDVVRIYNYVRCVRAGLSL